MELKRLDISSTEIKFGAEGGLEFSGYASKFNGLDSYGDKVIAGAYANTLKDRKRPIQLRWNHYGSVIGKFTEVREDEQGLFVVGELTKGHSQAEDTAALLRHGAISGLSIGYFVKDSEQVGVVRHLKEIELVEISVVEDPADLDAQITGVKSELNECKSLKEVERVMRNQLDLSQSAATAIVSAVKAVITHGDRVDNEKKTQLEILNQFKVGK